MSPSEIDRAVRWFADDAKCSEYLRAARWGTSPICPQCGGNEIGLIATRGLLKCKECGRQFSEVRGTLLEDSPLPIGHWLMAVWSVANGDEISSHELGRLLALRQPTAASLLSRVRACAAIAQPANGHTPQRIKPPGFDAFDALTRKLIAVPKAKVDAKVAADKAARRKAKRKK